MRQLAAALQSRTAAGANPFFAGLVFDAAGNLCGTTLNGGAGGYGVVFKLKPNPDGTWTESVLHSFTGGADGGVSYAGLVFDAADNLYGTTNVGGADGRGPSAGLVFDAAGNLYGATFLGGAGGDGVVFKLAPNADGSWTESVLHSFTGADGAYPHAGLILDAAGNLYGTTESGGGSAACSGGCGVVFKLALPHPGHTGLLG